MAWGNTNTKPRTKNSIETISLYTVTLLSADWSDTTPYIQTVVVEDMPATGYVSTDILLTDGNEIAELEAWGYVGRVDTADGGVTVQCFENKPTIDFNIQIRVVR